MKVQRSCRSPHNRPRAKAGEGHAVRRHSLGPMLGGTRPKRDLSASSHSRSSAPARDSDALRFDGEAAGKPGNITPQVGAVSLITGRRRDRRYRSARVNEQEAIRPCRFPSVSGREASGEEICTWRVTSNSAVPGARTGCAVGARIISDREEDFRNGRSVSVSYQQAASVPHPRS